MEGTPVFEIERQLLVKCLDQTVNLIHCTKAIEAIKRLTSMYDILSLNAEIERKYANSFSDDFYWDFASIQQLKQSKQELVVYHYMDFDPIKEFKVYGSNIDTLVRNVIYRYQNIK